MAESSAALLPVVIILAFGIVASVASHVLRVSSIVGYLALGLAIGAISPELIGPGGTTAFLGELGIAFLLFDIGLHFSLENVRREAGDIFGFGPVQVLIGTAALTGLMLPFTNHIGTALLVGAALSNSSTAVVTRVIAERHQRTCPVGLTATSIIIFQDIFSILLLIIASSLSTGSAWPELAGAIAKTGLAVSLVVILQKLLVRPLFAVLARHGEQEVFTALALVIAMASGYAASRIGLSLTLGAFLGGMVLAESPFRALIRSEIAPFKGLLIGLFFISVGASIDLSAVLANWPAILALTIGLIVIKGLANTISSLIFRWSVPGSIQLGLLMAQGSEFAFVILAIPAVRALVGETLAGVVVIAVAASLAVTPAVSQLGRTFAGRLRARSARPELSELKPRGEAAPVLIIGMGRAGRAVADGLAKFGIGYDAVERDGDRLRDAIADGYHVFFGNADDPRFWHAAELGERRFSLRTTSDRPTMSELQPIARELFPTLRRIVVVPDPATADEARTLGVEPVVARGEEAGVRAAQYLLSEFQIDPVEIERWSERELAMA